MGRHVGSLSPLVVAVGCMAFVAARVSGQVFQTSGSDFLPRVQDRTILTDAHNDPGNFDVPNVRVSPYVFGLIEGDPYFTQDPGFNAPAGSMLPPGSYLGFNILSHLYYWGGTGKVVMSAPPNGESLQYTFGLNTRTITGGTSGAAEFTADSVVQNGFILGTVNLDGSLHKHLNAFLLNKNGTADPSASPPPSNGIYFASIEVTDSDPSIAKSAQHYLMYSNGMTTAQQVDAEEWLRDNYAPGTNLVFEPIPGDVNLDGKVDFPDLVTLARNYGSNNAAWSRGDLNGDGSVGFDDLVILARHYGQGMPTAAQLAAFGPAFAADVQRAFAEVPEPAGLTVLAVFSLALPRRRPIESTTNERRGGDI